MSCDSAGVSAVGGGGLSDWGGFAPCGAGEVYSAWASQHIAFVVGEAAVGFVAGHAVGVVVARSGG